MGHCAMNCHTEIPIVPCSAFCTGAIGATPDICTGPVSISSLVLQKLVLYINSEKKVRTQQSSYFEKKKLLFKAYFVNR